LLGDVLDPVAKNYDVVMFDCPPTLGLLSVNALTASDRFVVPVTPQYLALEGLSTLMATIDRIRAGIDCCKTELMGILLTQVDRRGKATSEIIDLIRQNYGNSVFKTEVRINTRLAEAPSFGKTIFQHDWSAPGAQAYQDVAAEIMKRIKRGDRA
jgi:chromosome partitioning protein